MRTTKWPATAQREIHAKPKLTRFLASESQCVQKFIREIRRVSKPVLGIVESHGIYGLHFKSADAAFLHEAHFAPEFRLGNGGTPPTPAPQYSRVPRRCF